MEAVMNISLMCGEKNFQLDVPKANLVVSHHPPTALSDIKKNVEKALEHPTHDFPLAECVVPGDLVVLAVDPETPELALILEPVLEALARRMGGSDGISILESAQGAAVDQEAVFSQFENQAWRNIPWIKHDPAKDAECKYLATTAMAQPILLHEKLVDADVVIPIGVYAFDVLYGVRGVYSVLYPGFSPQADFRKAQRRGNSEIASDEKTPLKQYADEVGWLLGSMMTVQVIPAGNGGVAAVFAGTVEEVNRAAKLRLTDQWQINFSNRVDAVIAVVPPAAELETMEALSRILPLTKRCVKRGGRIILLSDIETIDPYLTSMLKTIRNPDEGLQTLAREVQIDQQKSTARVILEASDWAHLYLASELPDEIVRDMCLLPLHLEGEELPKLLAQSTQIAILPHPALVCPVIEGS
jgi:nickel-dependent lactate racemase